MAEDNEEKEGEEPEEGEQKKSKGPLKLLGGIVGLIGAGAMLAVMAKPSTEVLPSFIGPAMHSFFLEGEIVGNPLDDNFSRYLKFSPSCSFYSYDLAYPESRRLDEHYETLLKETMQFTISKYRMTEVMAGAARAAFSDALKQIAEPILFPVHLGMTASPYDIEEASGLRIGDSQERHGTFRGAFYDHVLKVNQPNGTIQLDESDEIQFGGQEYDLLVETEDGSKLFVDVSNLVEGFEGEVNVGVMGRIRRMFTGDIIAQ